MKASLSAFARHPSGMLGLLILAGVVALACLAPLLYPGNPWDTVGAPFMPPGSDGMLLGTDSLGRDIAADISYGARVSLTIGVISTLVAVVIGVAIGALSGFVGGRLGDALMRVTELFQTVPAFMLAVLLVAILNPSVPTIVLAIGLVTWPGLARLTRGEFLSLKSREFVQAAYCQGESPMGLMLRHILPNALSPLVVAASLSVGNAILIESALSFMGLSDPNLMTWGFMIGSARTMIRQAWWMSVFPGIAILLTTLSINLMGEGLNDVLNPRLARR